MPLIYYNLVQGLILAKGAYEKTVNFKPSGQFCLVQKLFMNWKCRSHKLERRFYNNIFDVKLSHIVENQYI